MADYGDLIRELRELADHMLWIDPDNDDAMAAISVALTEAADAIRALADDDYETCGAVRGPPDEVGNQWRCNLPKGHSGDHSEVHCDDISWPADDPETNDEQ